MLRGPSFVVRKGRSSAYLRLMILTKERLELFE